MHHSNTTSKKLSKFLELKKWHVKYMVASEKKGQQTVDETQVFFKKAIYQKIQ